MLIHSVIESYEIHCTSIEPKQFTDVYRVDILKFGETGPFSFRIFMYEESYTQTPQPGGFVVPRQIKSEINIASESEAKQKVTDYVTHRHTLRLKSL